jgi:uncharacterized protein YbjT (DUF2867 family)
MGNKKTLVVLGATGAQGGGLARAVLSDKNSEYSVRALSRNPSADKARELATLGAEVVAADMDDVESLTRAFSGADAAFCMTNFWEHFSVERELVQAKNLATAVARARIGHTIWSTLEDTRKKVPLGDDRMPTLQGKYKVPHFDGKGQADAYFRETCLPTTYLLTSFYWENFTATGMGPKRGPHGDLAIVLPIDGRRLPGIAAEDIGKCAYGVFKRGSELVGKTVGIAGGHLTGTEMAASLSRALQQPVAYKAVPPAVYRSFGFPGPDDLGNMFQYKRDFNDEYCAARSVAFSRSLNPELMSFADWLTRYARRIPIPSVRVAPTGHSRRDENSRL